MDVRVLGGIDVSAKTTLVVEILTYSVVHVILALVTTPNTSHA